jgi:site-specific DNA-methyltransferase (adenine-specific)/modification methylase
MAKYIAKEVINGQTLYLADNQDVTPTLGRFDAVVTDPPYGIGKALTTGGQGRGFHNMVNSGADEWDVTPNKSYLRSLIKMSDHQIFWGGNYLELPPTKKPLCWDKKRPNQKNLSEWEMAWTSLTGRAQMFGYCANGGFVKSEKSVHPTQKPVPLMEWCIRLLGHPKTVFDPFMGSGTTLVACVKMGISGTGIESREDYFKHAIDRVSLAARNEPDLFPTTGSHDSTQERLF